MTVPDEQYADLFDGARDPDLAHVVADLGRMRRLATAARVAPARDAAIRHALHGRALQQIQSARTGSGLQTARGSRRRLRGWSPRARPFGGLVPRWRLGSLRPALVAVVVALFLTLGSVLGYPRLGAPAPASAQAVLVRAAAAMRLAPYQAAHLTYRVAITPSPHQAGGPAHVPLLTRGTARYVVGTVVFTAEVWVQADASGAPTTSVQTLTTPEMQRRHLLVDRYIQVGSQIYGYDPGNNEIALRGTHDEQPGWLIPNGALDGARLTRELSALALHAPRQVRLLPRQTLGGSTVEAIQVNGWRDAPGLRTTFYFDAHSFLLRGSDSGSFDPTYPTASWRVRLSSYTTMAAAAVPPHTFTLNAPANAQVATPLLDPAGFASAFTTVCHRTLDVSRLQQIRQARRRSLLAACQATAPNTRGKDLVTALVAPYRTTLEGAAAAGQITPAQEHAALAAQQRWLKAFVATPGGVPAR